MIDIRQSGNYAKYMESFGWIVEDGAFIKKLWFTSIVKIQRPSVIDLEKLKKYRPFLIKLEPGINFKLPRNAGILREAHNFQISNFKFHRDNWPLIPSKTIILDLKNINLPKDTRYEIRKAEKAGVFIRGGLAGSQDHLLQGFIKSWHQHASRKGFWVPLHKEIRNLAAAFGKDCFLFMCSGAGALVLKNNQTAHYVYAFSTPEGRKVSAPYLVMWEIIKFCKSKKIKFLDLEGIYDERYKSSTKNWQGFTKFKMGWGGKIIEYPGSWTKYSLPFNIFPVLKIDSTWLSIFADLSINLAAGFYALIIIAPNFPGLEFPYNFLVLTMDIFSGTVFLFLAHWLRKISKKKINYD